MYTQKDREEYDTKLKICLKDMTGLSDNEMDNYIFNAYDQGKITMEMSHELTEIRHSTLRMIEQSTIAEKS